MKLYRAQCHCNIHLFLHDRAGTSASLLYKDEKPSVCLSVRTFFVTLITLPSSDVSTPDLLEMKAMSSGINKFLTAAVRRPRRFERRSVVLYVNKTSIKCLSNSLNQAKVSFSLTTADREYGGRLHIAS